MSDIARIVTTQNVAINYRTANIGERLLARLLDLLFLFAYFWVSYFICSAIFGFLINDFAENWEDNSIMMSSVMMIMFLPIMTYTLWVETVFNGRSFGKMIMGLKVVKTSGLPAGAGDFAFRWVTRMLEGESGIFTCLALPVAIISKRSQRVGDMVAGTIVISTKKTTSLRNTILTHLNPQYRIVFPQVAALSDKDVNTIRDVMLQSFETGNNQLLEYLGHKVKTTMNVFPPPQQLPTMQFLNIVLADYAHFNFHGK
jgi:uncharacterized RDD family membrane protein YckC